MNALYTCATCRFYDCGRCHVRPPVMVKTGEIGPCTGLPLYIPIRPEVEPDDPSCLYHIGAPEEKP